MKAKRTIGHFNREQRLNDIRRRRIRRQQQQGRVTNTTIGNMSDIEAVTSHIYTDDEIKRFDMDKAIDNHPLSRKPTFMRSKIAYREIMAQISPNPRYLVPGMFTIFGYRQPKYKEQLEYYDATPAVIFFGLTRTKDSNIREVGFNLHYFPPYTRGKIITTVYNVFRQYYDKYFNDVPSHPNHMLNYEILKKLLDRYGIGFGLRMYIPVLRGQTYVLPTRMVATMAYTEGHFNGATLGKIQRLWRKYKR